jgi:Type II secretion system (T2SS), protein M subtype b
VILGTAVSIRGVPWVLGAWQRLRMQTEAQVENAQRARAILADQASVRDSLDRVLGEIVALAPQLVDGRSSAEAVASLSGLISLAASRHGLKVLRLDPLPDSATGVFQRVQVHAELEGDVAAVAGMLRAIETGDPLLSIGSLALTPSDPFSPKNTGEVLHIELEVAGYSLPRSTP